jgi:hypothetical protein
MLRVIVSAPEIHESDTVVLPLPISCESLQAIRSAWHFPSEFLRMLLSTMPIASKFAAGVNINIETPKTGATSIGNHLHKKRGASELKDESAMARNRTVEAKADVKAKVNDKGEKNC